MQQAARTRSRGRATIRPSCATRMVAQADVAAVSRRWRRRSCGRVRACRRAGSDDRPAAAPAATRDLRWPSRSATSPGNCRSSDVTRPSLRFRRQSDRRGRRRRDRGTSARTLNRAASPSSPWASSAATSSIIHPTSTFCCCSIRPALPRRERDDAGEAAVRIGRRMIEILQKRTEDGYVQRVDLRLRPSPEVTPIALPVNAAISHYESSALPWERAAFIRARAAAGDLALGRRFLDSIQPFVWRRSLDFGVIEEVRQISARIRDHFAQGATIGPGFDLKRGRGGIREVEFFVQIQQMIHGGRDASVRAPAPRSTPSTRLSAPGSSMSRSAAELAEAYRLLRTVEHRVQMVDDAQTHLLPASEAALDNVAQLHGLADGGELLAALQPHVDRVGRIFDGLAPDERSALSNDPDILKRRTRRASASAIRKRRRAMSANWRSGKARSLRSPAARHAFEAMLSGSPRGDRCGGPAGPRAQPPQRYRRAAVERRELLPVARGAAAARQAARDGACRMRRRSPTSWRAGPSCSRACSTRRASRCRPARTSSPGASPRRCASSRMMSRSTARGASSTSAASRSVCS